MQTVRAAYEFILDIMRLTVSYLHQIPTGLTIGGRNVSLFAFMVGVTIMTIVITGVVVVVRAPVNVAHRQRVERSHARNKKESSS